MREKVVKIGQPTPLLGVMTEPEENRRNDMAIILLNSGVMHRIGSCRLSVKVARSIADEVGITALRFDFSGVGDSEPRSGGVDFESAVVSEVVEVMDYMQSEYGVSRFVLFGLCSGGHVACRVGGYDSRVTHIIQIDGHCYPTWKSWYYHYAPKVLSLERWLGRFKKAFAGVSSSGSLNGAEVAGIESEYFEVPDFGTTPERRVIADRLKKIIDNRISLFCFYTGRQPSYNYANQFVDCYHDVDFGDSLKVCYMPDSSHIVSDPESQSRVVWETVHWLQDHLLR